MSYARRMANPTTIWLPRAGAGDLDYVSPDGRKAFEVKRGIRACRDLQAAALQVANWLAAQPDRDRATLVLDHPAMSLPRIQGEWAATTALLRPVIAERLNLLVVESSGVWSASPGPELAKILEDLKETGHDQPAHARQLHPGRQLGPKHFEVIKLLLDRWLLREGPIRIQELAASVGCSYPTVQIPLKHSLLQKWLRVASNRSVELKAFPVAAWRELRVRNGALFPALRFQDRSGDQPDPLGLVRRLKKQLPGNVALGGVLAARHWDPDLDLNGTPRLDLAVHAPDGNPDLTFVRALDPALTLVDDPTASAALVVHPLYRAASRFAAGADRPLPLSSPIETALHLHDLGLDAQAIAIINRLRPEARLT